MADESKAASQGAGFRFRDTTRAPFTTTVRLRFDRLGSTVAAQSADISMEGMFVKTEEPRPVGTLVQFEFDIEDQDTSGAQEVVQGLGDVVWVRTSGGTNKPSGMGIQFRYVDAHSREHVYRIVTNFIREISGDGAEQSVPETADGSRPAAVATPLGTNATVAAPLAALPGWNEASDVGGPEVGLTRVSPGTNTNDDGQLSIQALGPPGASPLGSDPPALTPSATDGPFRALLNPEAADRSTPPLPSVDLPAPPALGAPREPSAMGSASESFSLSVPKLGSDQTGLRAHDEGVPLGAHDEAVPLEAHDHGVPLGAELPRSTREPSGTPLESELGSTDSMNPTLNPIGDDSAAAADEPLPQFGGLHGAAGELTSLRPIEPYDPEVDLQDAAGGGYYGGRASSGESRKPLFAGLLIVGLVAAGYFTKPWQYLEALRSGADSPTSTSDPTSAPDAAAVAADIGEGPPTLTNELANGDSEAPDSGTSESEVESGVEGAGGSPDDATVPSSGTRSAQGSTPRQARVAAPGSSSTRSSGAAESAPRARRLETLDAADFADRTQVRLVADEPIVASNYSTAALSGPPRFLVKIKGITSTAVISSSSSRFVSIRTGLHQVEGMPELHVVFDMTSAGFAAEVRLDRGELLLSFR